MPADVTPVTLRPAAPDDGRFLFECRNDPAIVARGTSQRTVMWDEHCAWFDASLADPGRRLLFIAETGAIPVGVVRFDRDEAGATVSAYLAPRFIGKGLGVAAIRAGCAEAKKHWGVARILACVRDDNDAGQRAFLKAGFESADAGLCPSRHTAFLLHP